MTKKFIKTIKTYFKILNYKPKDILDFNKFEKSAYKAICFSKDNDSLRSSIYIYTYCLKKWAKIEKIFSKPRLLQKFQKINDEYFADFYSLTYERRRNQMYRYILTNSYKNQIICFFLNDVYGFQINKKGTYFVEIDNNKYQVVNRGYKGTAILNENGNLICNAFYNLDKNCLVLSNNISSYDVIYVENDEGNNYMGIYKKVDSGEFLVGIIDFGWFSSKSPESFASLEIYEDDVDEALLICFAMSFIISTYNNVMHWRMLNLYAASLIQS